MKSRVHFFRASSIFRSQLDQHGGIRRREVLDLFEHPSQRRAVAYDLIKSAWRGILIRRIEHLGAFIVTSDYYSGCYLIAVLH
jgi:hypothetical protein